MHHTGDTGVTSGGHPPSLGTDLVRKLGVASLLFSPCSPRYRKKKKIGNSGLMQFPLTLDPSHHNQLRKHHQNLKKEERKPLAHIFTMLHIAYRQFVSYWCAKNILLAEHT